MTKIQFKRNCLRVVLAAAFGMGSMADATASLLVYEGFNGYTTGTLAGQTVNSNAIGLSGTYVQSGTGQYTAVTSSGLVFGSGATTYATSGGSLWNPSGDLSTLSIGLNTGTVSETLYGSYLFKLGSTYGPNGGTRMEVRFNTASNSGTAASYLNAAVVNSSAKMSLKYDASSAMSTSAALSSTLSAGVTYMAITKWTGVSSGSGTGTLWILTSAQYDASGGVITESFLNSNALISLTTSGSGSSVLNDSDYLQFLPGGATVDDRALDEIKYGTTLLDVTSVPEPHAMALAVSGFCAMLIALKFRRLSV